MFLCQRFTEFTLKYGLLPAKMTNIPRIQTREITAAVVRKKGGPFQVETLTLEEPRPDEALIRIVATGMCHTDMVARDQLYTVPLPVVLGHEGAGIVERVGSSVKKAHRVTMSC